MEIKRTDLREYDYDLPHERIAQHPSPERDGSKLLLYKNGTVREDIFRNLDRHIPEGSLLVFNNTRVIKARLLFRKETGAIIEILCLEPLAPAGYELSFGSREPVEWKCIVGNLKKWKSGKLSTTFSSEDKEHVVTAQKIKAEGEAWRIMFSWESTDLSFGEVVELTGRMPLPPYVEREAEEEDLARYQTIYSLVKGSVAAPTAGLHFTEEVMDKLRRSGIHTAEVTLHVGAGTFKPIKSENVEGHEMHCEHFIIKQETVEQLKQFRHRIIAVGTTSVRTLESLYWLGIKISRGKAEKEGGLTLGQWEPYDMQPDLSLEESMEYILKFMRAKGIKELHASTNIMIVPGYNFMMIRGMITNFHQPMSTLLLLVSAWTDERWKDIYSYALENGFRFLSYGDCSLLLRIENDSE